MPTEQARLPGHSELPLARKLGIGPGDEIAVIGAPDSFYAELGELPDVTLHTDLADSAFYDVIMAFSTSRDDLEADLPRMRAGMAPTCRLWIAWPKRESRVATDMSDEAVREVALPVGLVDTKVIAVDQTWTAVRLVNRRDSRLPKPTS